MVAVRGDHPLLLRRIAADTCRPHGISAERSGDDEVCPMTMADDYARRNPAINWPEGFKPEGADLYAHNELFIRAPVERVWSLLIDATNWPSWYPNCWDIRILTPGHEVLKAGSRFRWRTFTLDIETHVNEFTPNERIGWFSFPTPDTAQFYNAKLLEPREGGTNVVIEEVANGPLPEQFAREDEEAMHRGHEMWLAVLRWAAESR
jgi:uncharacterized protein YndB with AHSA1/START domain